MKFCSSDYIELVENIGRQKFSLVFDFLHGLSRGFGIPYDVASRVDSAESLYCQMLVFSRSAGVDPERDVLIGRLQYLLYCIASELYVHFGADSLSAFERSQRQLYCSMSPLNLDNYAQFLFDETTESQYPQNAANALILIWHYLCARGPIPPDLESQICSLADNHLVISQFMPLVLSALALNAANSYDPAALRIALRYSQSDNAAVAVRAQYLLLVILSSHYRVIRVESQTLRLRLFELLADADLLELLKKLVMTIVATRNVPKVIKEIEEQVMLHLRENRDLFRFSNLEDSIDANPVWDRIKENETLSDDIRKLSEMQADGVDIFANSFARMKTYPFFSEMSNWFLLFDARQRDVFGVLPSDQSELLRSIPLICNSDKFSIVLAAKKFGFNPMGGALNMDQDDIEAMREDNGGVAWKGNVDVLLWAMRNYVQDMYRFYIANQDGMKMKNTLEAVVEFFSSDAAFEYFPIQFLRDVAREFIDKELWCEAKFLYSRMQDEEACCDQFFFQQMGYAYQNSGEYGEAVRAYDKADILGGGDVWLLRQKAFCCRRLGQYQNAAGVYERLLAMKEDDISVISLLINCYFVLERFSEAHTLAYKAYFLRPDSIRVLRLLAWCLFREHKYSEALDVYRKIVDGGDADENDNINMGHAFRMLNADTEADRCYYRALAMMERHDAKTARARFVDEVRSDAGLITRKGETLVDVNLMADRILMLPQEEG